MLINNFFKILGRDLFNLVKEFYKNLIANIILNYNI